MDIMPGGPADDQLLPRALEQLGGSLRRQRRPARRASEGAVSDSGTESGEDGGEIGALLQGLRDGRRRPSLQLVSEAMTVLGRLRESLGVGEDSTEVLQLVDRLQSSLKQKAAPVPPPRRGAHRRGRRAQTVGITREELAEIRRRLAAARKPTGTESAAERGDVGKAEATDNAGKAGVAAPAPKASSTLYSAGVRPFPRRFSQETQRRRVASPQRLRRGPPPPPWLGARRDPASSSVQRVVAAVNASNARPPSPPPRRAARQPRPHTIGANEDDFAVIRAAIDSELKREVGTSQQEIYEPTDRNGPDPESANQARPMPPHLLQGGQNTAENQSDRQQIPSDRREEAVETLVPQRAIVHESRGQYAQSSVSRVHRQGDAGRPAVESPAGAANTSPSSSPSQRSPRPSGAADSPNLRASLTSALTKQMTKEYLSDSSRVSREQVLGGSLSGHPSAVSAPDPTAATPAPQPPTLAQTSDPVSEPAAAGAEPEDAEPAQYTCSIITQETQTAELPPPSPTADGAPADRFSPPGGPRPPSLGHHQLDAVAVAPPVVSPSSPVSRHPPWARQARVAESVSPEGTSPTPSSQPIWARHGRSARPASAEVASPSAGGGQLPWARHTRPTARASSVTRMASAFNAADAPPPPLSSTSEDRRTRLQKTRSLYAPSGGPESGEHGAAPLDGRLDSPPKPRKLSIPDGSGQRHALARSKSAEHLFGRDRKPLMQTPFHKFENIERQRETQMAALRAEQRAQREHQQQLQQQQQAKQLLLQQQQQQLAQQQQQHPPPGIAVIPHQRTIPDRLHGQQSQNHAYQGRPAAPQQHVNVHRQDTTDSCQSQSHAPQQPAVQHGPLTTAARPPLSPQHHPQPAHHQPTDTRPSLNLQTDRSDHHSLHHQGPHHQPQGSQLVQSPTYHQGPSHQQGSIHPQDIQYQQGAPAHAPSLPTQHGPQYSQVLPQQEIHTQGPPYYHQHPYHGQVPQLPQDQGHQQVPQHYSGPHQTQSAQYYPQEHQAHIHNHSYQHVQGLPHQTGQHAMQPDQSFQQHQSPQQHRSPQNIQSPQYQQTSQQEQKFHHQKSPQPPLSPQYPSSPSQQQGVHHLGPYQEPHQHHQPLHQEPPVPQYYHQHPSVPQQQHHQPSVPQHYQKQQQQQQPSVPQQHHQVGSTSVFQSPPLSPGRPDGLSPRSGQPSSHQAADRGFRPPADSARHSGVFVPVTAAADTEGESRPPWAGSRSTGRVKQRAASLSGAEPPPRPDLAAGRPPSGDFGRHVSAFASTGHGRVPPRAVLRQSSWDSAPDLRTGPLVRAAAGPPPTRDGQPDLRTAPLARAKQQQLPPTDHRPDLRTASQVRSSHQHPAPQKEHGSNLRTAPLSRASQQQPPQTNHGPDLRTAPMARTNQQQQHQQHQQQHHHQQQHQQQHHQHHQHHHQQQHQQHQRQQLSHPPPVTLRTGGPRSPAAAAGGGGLQRSSSSDVLRCGGGMRPYEARLDSASAQQKKRQLDSFFQEREDEQLARSFDDLLDDEDLALVAPAGKSAGGSPHALAKSHTVGDMRSARRRPTAAGGSFARRQHAWESSTGASMAVGLGSSSTSTARSASKSRNKNIDEDTLDLVRKYFAKEGM